MRTLWPAIRRLDKRRLAWLAGSLLTGACLAFVGYVVYRERDVLVLYLLKADVHQLLAVVGWYLADLAIYILGWAAIMRGLGAGIRLAHHARIFCLANAAKRLPGTLWYVGGRTALYSRAGVSSRAVIAGSAIEGALTWLSGLAMAVPFLMVILPDRRWIWLSVGGLLLVGLLNPASLRWFLCRATKNGEAPSIALAQVYALLLLYVVGWVVGGVFLAAILSIFYAVHIAQLPYVVGAWPVAGTASMLTIFLPSGFGVTEVTLTALLSRLMPAGVAVLAAVSARLLTTLLDVALGSLAYLIEVTQRQE